MWRNIARVQLMNKLNYRESKFEQLRKVTEDRVFSVSDAERALNIERSSVHWLLHNLTAEKRLIRVARGYYAIAPEFTDGSTEPTLSLLAQKVVGLLKAEGLQFYVTGLDILGPYFDQVPATYPPLIYVEKGSSDWAVTALEQLKIPILVNPKRGDISIARSVRAADTEPLVLRETAEFGSVSRQCASAEKAFVDLYYEITRGYYEFPLGDLAHMLVTFYFRGKLNPVRMLQAARRRRIELEIRYLLDAGLSMFHEPGRPTMRLSQPAQQFIRTIRKLRNQIAHGQNR